MPADTPVTLAVIIGAHGVAGEVRLKVFAGDLKPYKSFNNGTLTLKSTRPGSNGMIARIAEVNDRNAAEALRGTVLTVPRDSLPPLAEGEYYHADLIGLAAVTATGEPIGRVIAIHNFGAGDIIEVAPPHGATLLLPFTDAVVPTVDIAGGRVVIELPQEIEADIEDDDHDAAPSLSTSRPREGGDT